MSVVDKCLILENKFLNKDVVLLKIKSEAIASEAFPGQFVNIKCSDTNDALLRRPISICSCDKENSTLDIVYQIKGKGTKLLSRFSEGDFIDIMGPLGNTFQILSSYKKIAVVGGGIGTFPLLNVLQNAGNCETHAFLGFRNKESIVLEDEFAKAADKLVIMTDDGSNGNEGFAITPFVEHLDEKYDCVFVCGPDPMIKGVAQTCLYNNIKCFVSLEQRMACGIGACLVCACKMKSDRGLDFEHLHVCKNGPVFNANKLFL